jgi:hypothetical protein
VSHPADDIKLELHQFLTENVEGLDDEDALFDDLNTVMASLEPIPAEFVRRIQKWLAST